MEGLTDFPVVYKELEGWLDCSILEKEKEKRRERVWKFAVGEVEYWS